MRRRIRESTPNEDPRFWWFIKAADDSFTKSWFNAELFASEREAARVWPACRQSVWGRSRRMSIPRAAEVFDGFTRDGWTAMWGARGCVRFAADEALAAIARDRLAVEAFAQRDRRGAKTIHSYLTLWLEDLDALEAQARAVLESGEPPYLSGGWSVMSPSGYYDADIDPNTNISGF